ncbi:MAG TPA: AAA family ATPase, partial [Pirellulaceae bacterium]|nr:AAA family ATPase [Pirellulaceae bacterium]
MPAAPHRSNGHPPAAPAMEVEGLDPGETTAEEASTAKTKIKPRRRPIERFDDDDDLFTGPLPTNTKPLPPPEPPAKPPPPPPAEEEPPLAEGEFGMPHVRKLLGQDIQIVDDDDPDVGKTETETDIFAEAANPDREATIEQLRCWADGVDDLTIDDRCLVDQVIEASRIDACDHGKITYERAQRLIYALALQDACNKLHDDEVNEKRAEQQAAAKKSKEYRERVARAVGKEPDPEDVPLPPKTAIEVQEDKAEQVIWDAVINQRGGPQFGQDGREVLPDQSMIDRTRAKVEKLEADFATVSLGELAGMDLDQEYLIEDFLAAGEKCVMAGPSKLLKTSLFCHLALCLATGRPFLGHAVPKRRRVLYFSG